MDFSTTAVTASQRTDYTHASGTLRFAAGESSKTIDVLISEDIRLEGNETLTVTLSNGTGQALLGSPSTASIVIADDPIEAGPNPINFNDIFVGQHYHDFLARHADNPGSVFWQNQIFNCGTNAACIDDRRTNVSAAFFLSIEFQQTGYFVIRVHKAAFGSVRSVPRYLHFLRDQRRVTDGVIVGNTGWDALLAANRQAYLEGLFRVWNSFPCFRRDRTRESMLTGCLRTKGWRRQRASDKQRSTLTGQGILSDAPQR